jgi:hypothetical protein
MLIPAKNWAVQPQVTWCEIGGAAGGARGIPLYDIPAEVSSVRSKSGKLIRT